MKYLLAIYEDERAWSTYTPEQSKAVMDAYASTSQREAFECDTCS